MNNPLSYYGLVDARVCASEKYLPVNVIQFNEPIKVMFWLEFVKSCIWAKVFKYLNDIFMI